MRSNVVEACNRIGKLEDDMVSTIIGMCSIPAISPKSGGDGEVKKAEWLVKHLRVLGFSDIKRLDSPDPEVSSGKRPNIIVRIPGKNRARTTWVITHTDVVPAGDLKEWRTDPFKPVRRGDKVYGRGVEDNGQAMVSSIFAAKALIDLGIAPRNDIALALVADEEVGSLHGIQFLLKKRIFDKNDLILVPDSGSPGGNLIEVAEKASIWIKFTVLGKQTHAAIPGRGLNAHRIGARLICALDLKLNKRFNRKDALFSPPVSTFEPTKKDANVPNINTVPGLDVFYFDCRILPCYTPQVVMSVIKSEVARITKDTGAKVTVEIVNGGKASPVTQVSSEVYRGISDAIEEVRGFKPKPFGIGGGTCAAHFRQAGFPAVVWATSDEIPHTPNEYIRVKNLVDDAKVYAALFI